MDQEKKIEEAVEKTLQEFNSAERLQAGPLFLAQVRAKINGLNHGKRQAYLPALGLLRFAALVLLVVLNVVTATYFLKSDPAETYERSQLISAFAQEYALELDE